MVFLGAGLIGILIQLSDVVVGGLAPEIVGGGTALGSCDYGLYCRSPRRAQEP
jgi:hypothetical protein